MAYIIVLSAVFGVMLLAPLVLGYFSIDRGVDNALVIRQNNIRDARYFSRAFTKLIEKALGKYSGQGTIYLSKEEELAFAEDVPGGSPEWNTLVVAHQPFDSAGVGFFTKEIYAKQGARIGPNCDVRAIASGRQLVLEENCRVLRWADAEEELCARQGCDLGISASSGQSITLDVGCRFDRLYAPEVLVAGGFSEREADHNPARLLATGRKTKKSTEQRFDVSSVGANTEIYNTIISKSGIRIGESATVYGDVKSAKGIHIQRGAAVIGNVFAEGDIVIEEDVYIGGVVFTQESVFVGARSEIGRYGVIKSLVAREEIVLCNGAAVFGYVHCERGGRTVNEEDFADIIAKRF